MRAERESMRRVAIGRGWRVLWAWRGKQQDGLTGTRIYVDTFFAVLSYPSIRIVSFNFHKNLVGKIVIFFSVLQIRELSLEEFK